jgi:hypothetical protein
VFYIDQLIDSHPIHDNHYNNYRLFPEGKNAKYIVKLHIEDRKIVEINNWMKAPIIASLDEIKLAYKELQKYNLVPAGKEPIDIGKEKNRFDNRYFAYRFFN